VLGPGRYLLGVVALALLVSAAWLGAGRVRGRLVPGLAGMPAQLATSVLALALLIWSAEILGTVSLFKPVPYLVLVVAVGLGLWRFVRPAPSLRQDGSGEEGLGATLVALLIALIAVIHFAGGVKTRLSTGMTGFDSTWYHGPFAAGFFQSGNTIGLHFIAPQFLAWFYPANGEIFHAAGMLAFGRDLLSPLLNLGWFLACLLACWSIGRPYRVGAWSLALGAVALSVPALADQAGEARNDLVGVFFLLAAVAVGLNAAKAKGEGGIGAGLGTGALVVVGLAAGLAAGTKLNFLLPAAVLVFGLGLVAPPGRRWRALWISGLAALAGGGYWYLRNLVQSGSPLPWIHHLGPIDLPAPEQALGGREAHTVLGYLTDGTVWSDWFLPGLHHAFWLVWPLLGAAALAGLLLALVSLRGSFWTRNVQKGPRSRDPRFGGSLGRGDVRKEPRIDEQAADRVLPVAGLAGLAVALAWLIAPTSASGPEGMPRGFESGLRYLAPALVLGLALLPAAAALRAAARRSAAWLSISPQTGAKDSHERGRRSRGVAALVLGLVGVAVVVGYPVQRHYLRSRYADPSFTAPGLNAAFAWARDVSDARIATTSTRQYPLFGTDLSNRVQFVGAEAPHGGFEAPATCRQWREELNAGEYDYVVTTRDRLEPGQPPFPPTTRWTESPEAEIVLKKPPTVVFKLKGPLDPSACPPD
jgi:hypothetical protein